MSPKTTNHFLASLTEQQRHLLTDDAEVIEAPRGTLLYASGGEPEYAYCLTSGLASTITTTPEGDSAEVGLVGPEGILGGLHVLGPARTQAQSIVQVDATALRIPFSRLKRLFHESEEIRERVLEFVQHETFTIIQVAGCHRLHGTVQRMCRWLLMVQDRVKTQEVELTHAFLALMLGIRRPTVTLALRELQQQGLLEVRRGSLQIVDRPGLERTACDCYSSMKAMYAELYRGAQARHADQE